VMSDIKGLLMIFALWFYAYVEFFWRLINPNYKIRSFKDDTVLITGGASGLGRLMCVEFAKLGARVVAVDVNEEGLRETDALVQSEAGKSVACYVCDLTDKKSIYEVAKQVLEEVGDVTVLVNNAGLVQGKSLLDTDDKVTQRIFDVNIMAQIWTTKAFLPRLITSGRRGNLVYIASFAGWFGGCNLSDYCASKAASISFSECVDLELIKCGLDHRIRVTCVCPYIINTGMFTGFKSRFHFLLPHYSPGFVVSEIVKATRRGDSYVVLPKMTHVLRLLKVLLPETVMKELSKVVGGLNAMDAFSGRSKKRS